jgi:hypothetical protein
MSAAAANVTHKLIVTGLVGFSIYGFVKITGGTRAIVQDVQKRKVERLAEIAAEEAAGGDGGDGAAALPKDARGKTKLGDL